MEEEGKAMPMYQAETNGYLVFGLRDSVDRLMRILLQRGNEMYPQLGKWWEEEKTRIEDRGGSFAGIPLVVITNRGTATYTVVLNFVDDKPVFDVWYPIKSRCHSGKSWRWRVRGISQYGGRGILESLSDVLSNGNAEGGGVEAGAIHSLDAFIPSIDSQAPVRVLETIATIVLKTLGVWGKMGNVDLSGA